MVKRKNKEETFFTPKETTSTTEIISSTTQTLSSATIPESEAESAWGIVDSESAGEAEKIKNETKRREPDLNKPRRVTVRARLIE